MTTATEIIVDAYERLNRLSPGEQLSADDAAFGLRRLNSLVDELSTQNLFLYRSVITSAAQTGDIVLGLGDWAAIQPGDEVVSATCNNSTLAPITVAQYMALYRPVPVGFPCYYSADGLGAVSLYPLPSGQTVSLQTRTGVAEFADHETEYTLPRGWKAALGAALAVRLAPVLLGTVPAPLIRAEKKAMDGVQNYIPAIVNAVAAYERSGASGGLGAVLYGRRGI